MTDHTCYYEGSQDCIPCKEDFDASPAGIVTKAIEALDSEGQQAPLGDLLQILADEMSDEGAVEREFPANIPAARWLVCDFRRGDWRETDRWTAGLAVARSILGLPNPNAVVEAGAR